MFFNYDKLMTTGLKAKVFYHFSVGLLKRITEMLSGNSKIEPYITILQQRMKKLEKAYFHNRRSPLTSAIQRKQKVRTDFLAALRRQINSAQKMVFNPELVKVADAFKRVMQGNDWWNFKDRSYTFTTLLINNLLDEMALAPYAQWVEALSLQSLFDGLKTAHEEFESLFASRLDGQSEDETPQQKVVKKELFHVVNVILTVIDFGASNEASEYAVTAKKIDELITIANGQTKSEHTRSQSEDTEQAGEPSGENINNEASEVHSSGSSTDE